ncbi:MAG: hypothetical protein ACJAVN_000006 [Roseivirga sp.]|jgi:hypothetical protein
MLMENSKTKHEQLTRIIESSSDQLSFRNLGLTVSDVTSVANTLQQRSGSNPVKSISFSYNALGDEGAIAFANSFPHTITEVGLVGCAIGDKGGLAVLNWAKTSKHLRMICIEQNSFSDALKSEYSQFSNEHPEILVVY